MFPRFADIYGRVIPNMKSRPRGLKKKILENIHGEHVYVRASTFFHIVRK